MNKILILVIGLMMFSATFVEAASQTRTTDKLKHTRTVKARKDTTVTYAGIEVFVPAGQTITLGKNKENAVVIRADKMENVKVGATTIASNEPAVVVVQPKQNSFTIVEGNNVQITDANGRVAKLSEGASVSGEDIRDTLEEPTLPPVDRVAPMHPRRIAEMEAEAKAAAKQSKGKTVQKK